MTGFGEAEVLASCYRRSLAVIDEVEPSSDDGDYLSHPRWPVIADGARAALDVMVG